MSATANFAALGIGALVGFSMRDVIGWLGNLTGALFNGQSQNKGVSSPHTRRKAN